MTIDTSKPVLVTGATGYVAGWLIKRLLDAGVTVHAAVRDASDAEKLKHLKALPTTGQAALHVFQADLLENGSYAAGMRGCGVVFHTASPFTSKVTDPQKELIDPAFLGTRNVMEEARRTDSVTRVVVTSSCAAIYTDAADCADAPNGTLTEAVWNTTASLDYQPYSLSKTMAEREAWRLAEGAHFRLVTVNPSLVMGPAIGGRPTSESFEIMRRTGSGEFKAGGVRFGLGMVDVREVAQAHLAAAFLPHAQGRHIVNAEGTDLLSAVQWLQPRFGADYPLPNRAIPKWLVWLVAPRIGLPRKLIRRSVNVPWQADNRKSREALGITYRPLRDTMEDMFQYMVDEGYF